MGDVAPTFPKPRADRLVDQLELTLEGICLACLSFVSFPLDQDAPWPVVEGAVRRLTPDLWVDGLEQQAFDAVRRAVGRGVPDAEAALADLEAFGPRSGVARAIVRGLARQLVEWERRDRLLVDTARPRLQRAPSELN
jgi:hypothetical protein